MCQMLGSFCQANTYHMSTRKNCTFELRQIHRLGTCAAKWTFQGFPQKPRITGYRFPSKLSLQSLAAAGLAIRQMPATCKHDRCGLLKATDAFTCKGALAFIRRCGSTPRIGRVLVIGYNRRLSKRCARI